MKMMCANKVHSRKRTPTPLSKLQEVDNKIGHHDPPKKVNPEPHDARGLTVSLLEEGEEVWTYIRSVCTRELDQG